MKTLSVSILFLSALCSGLTACAVTGSPETPEVSAIEAHLDNDPSCGSCDCDPFFCSDPPDPFPPGGEEGGPGTGGDEEGEPHQDNPYALAFYSNGRSPNLADTCVQLLETADPYWSNNYLCSYANLGIRWSSAGPLPGLYCVAIREPAEPTSTTWRDNYLCAPNNIFGLNTRWSYAGKPLGLNNGCVNFNDPQDPHTWGDNWLCY